MKSFIFACVCLIPTATSVSGDDTPVPGNTAVLEIKGDSKKAIKALQQQGIATVELKGTSYVLPSIQISGPETVKSGGRMVTVSATLDKTTLPDNLLSVKFQWTVLVDGVPSKSTLVWPDGTKIIFGSSDNPGNTTVILDVDCLYGVQTSAVIGGKSTDVYTDVETNSGDLQVHNIVVEDAAPCPPPAPTPQPPSPAPIPVPTPPSLPEGKYGLAQVAYSAFVNSNMTNEQKYKVAQALAASFKSVTDKIGDGYNNFDEILADTATANKLAVSITGVPPAVTASANQAIGDKLYQLTVQSNQITTSDDLKTAFLEIQTGLAAVPAP